MRKSILTIMAVVAMVTPWAVAAPAQAQGRSVQQIIQAKTGASGSLITVKHRVATEVDIGVGLGGDGKALDTYAQQSRVMAVLPDESQTSASFTLTLPKGARIERLDDGSAAVVRDTEKYVEVYGTIEAPWAMDAAGKSLPTSYAVNGNILTQNVDTAGAVFPVVADPSYAAGFYRVPVFYITYTRAETIRMHDLLGLSAPSAILSCAYLGPAAVACGVAASVASAALTTQLNYANSVYHRCLKIRAPLLPVYWPISGSIYTVYC